MRLRGRRRANYLQCCITRLQNLAEHVRAPISSQNDTMLVAAGLKY